MNAADEVSRDALETIAMALGGSPTTREMIQSAYAIGRIDGKIEASRAAISKMQQKVAA
jgi:tellurite resistance protein